MGEESSYVIVGFLVHFESCEYLNVSVSYLHPTIFLSASHSHSKLLSLESVSLDTVVQSLPVFVCISAQLSVPVSSV